MFEPKRYVHDVPMSGFQTLPNRAHSRSNVYPFQPVFEKTLPVLKQPPLKSYRPLQQQLRAPAYLPDQRRSVPVIGLGQNYSAMHTQPPNAYPKGLRSTATAHDRVLPLPYSQRSYHENYAQDEARFGVDQRSQMYLPYYPQHHGRVTFWGWMLQHIKHLWQEKELNFTMSKFSLSLLIVGACLLSFLLLFAGFLIALNVYDIGTDKNQQITDPYYLDANHVPATINMQPFNPYAQALPMATASVPPAPVRSSEFQSQQGSQQHPVSVAIPHQQQIPPMPQAQGQVQGQMQGQVQDYPQRYPQGQMLRAQPQPVNGQPYAAQQMVPIQPQQGYAPNPLYSGRGMPSAPQAPQYNAAVPVYNVAPQPLPPSGLVPYRQPVNPRQPMQPPMYP